MDEQEIINDFNGNLMYRIPLYNFQLAGDIKFDMSLNYNGAVGHQVFVGDTGSYNSNPDGNRYNINTPEWIIDFDGIGVQVMNFETHFFSNKVSNNQISSYDLNALIPGYHFNDNLQSAGDPGVGPNRINLLAGDGSVITTRN